MKIDKEIFIRKLILSEQTDTLENLLGEELYSYLTESTNIQNTIYSLISIIESKECKENNLVEFVAKNYKNMLSIFEDHDIKIPEIECILEKIVSEEEAASVPTNSTDGIDATTPRIIKKKKDEKQESDPV